MSSILDKPVGGEQIERIRQLSQVSLGSHGAAFEKYGYPSTRGQASEILKRLDRERRWGGEDNDHQEEPMTQEPAFTPPEEDLVLDKTCARCKKDKPLAEFGKDKSAPDGLNYKCKQCIRDIGAEARAKKGSKPKTKPATPKPEPTPSVRAADAGHFALASDPDPDPPLSVDDAWREVFANPTLEKLEALRAFLEVASLDEAARITRIIAGSFAPKDAA